MKKPTAVIFTMLFGLVGSSLVCAAGVFAYSANIVIYIIATAALSIIYAKVLISVVEGIAESRGVWRGNPASVLKGDRRVRRKAKGGPPSEKALLICAQAPILVLSLAYFISELAVYEPPSGSWRNFAHLGYELGTALCMFVTAVLTTAAAVVLQAARIIRGKRQK